MKLFYVLFATILFGANSGFAQWQPDLKLTNDPGMSVTTAYSNARSISSSGDTVHMVWSDNRIGGNYEIFYKRSTDRGTNRGTDSGFTNNYSTSLDASVSASGIEIH